MGTYVLFRCAAASMGNNGPAQLWHSLRHSLRGLKAAVLWTEGGGFIDRGRSSTKTSRAYSESGLYRLPDSITLQRVLGRALDDRRAEDGEVHCKPLKPEGMG